MITSGLSKLINAGLRHAHPVAYSQFLTDEIR
jgi:hypothetical protein